MSIYTFYDFLEYPIFALKIMFLRPYAWLKSSNEYQANTIQLFQHPFLAIWFFFGALNTIYQAIGLTIYYYTPVLKVDQDINELGELSEWLSLECYLTLSISKICTLYLRRERIIALLQELRVMFPSATIQRKQLSVPTVPTTQLQAAAIGYRIHHFALSSRRIMRRIAAFFLFLDFFYNTMPIIQLIYELTYPEQQLTYQYQSRTWYPWQSLKKQNGSMLNFGVAYVCQFFSILFCQSVIMGAELLFSFFITQMQLHFDFLANALLALDARTPNARTQLKELIQYHNRLVRLSNEINNIFNISFLVNVITSSITICLTALSVIELSVIPAMKYVSGCSFFLVLNFFFCYNGYLFNNASDKIMPAAFYSNWYEGDIAYQRMILFFITRSTRPQNIRIYNYIEVSMTTYMMILKFSYQLITFFRTME